MGLTGRYDRNSGSLTEAQQRKLARSSVLVLGCGGVGGYVIEYLARIGVGRIAAADGDVFRPSNLNRQRLSTEGNLGMNKALAGRERVRAINSAVDYEAVDCMVTEENAAELMRYTYPEAGFPNGWTGEDTLLTTEMFRPNLLSLT